MAGAKALTPPFSDAHALGSRYHRFLLFPVQVAAEQKKCVPDAVKVRALVAVRCIYTGTDETVAGILSGIECRIRVRTVIPVSYTHLRAHET